MPLSTLHFEARTSVSSILQNISDKGLCEHLLTRTDPIFREKIVKLSLESELKSRRDIEKKKKRKVEAIKALKKYAKKPAKVPRYKQPTAFSPTSTILDVLDDSDDEIDDNWF